MRALAGLSALAWLTTTAVSALAAEPSIPEVRPTIETANLPDNAFEADADDPAIWVHPTDPARSLIALAVKDGGIRVVDLRGRTVQVIDPARAGDERGRINNVDVAYGLRLLDGRAVDVVVASDRALDVIRVYRIDKDAKARPLVEITDPAGGRAFPTRPKAGDPGRASEPNPAEDQNTAYGLALWNDRVTGRLLAAVTQRGQPRIGLFRLVPRAGGRVAARYVRDFRFPDVHDGQDLRQEDEENPRRDFSPQFEGLVVDQRTGILYAGQEDVGIWRIDLRNGTRAGTPFYETRGSAESSFREPGSVISRDVEGLCIYYARDGKGYLIASSQGSANGEDRAPEPPFDDSFAAFALDGRARPRLFGSFRVVRNGGIDATQESDGADVLSLGLPGFPQGLFVTQDGYDNDDLSGETDSTNFKLVPWDRVARAFSPPLAIQPQGYDPRDP